MSEEEIQTPHIAKDKTATITKLGAKIVSIVFMLGTVGQIAWAIENTWFNTFIYDEISKDPTPIAWMVAVSAITATITTLFMGTASDRTRSKMGRRKPYILFGYILWGIITALFPLTAFIETIGFAVVTVIITDAIMTFFGSMANDAAYNAWLTDVSDSTNRNRIQGFNAVTVLIANIIALGAAGILIDNLGYYYFFFIMGGLVSIIGLIAGVLIKSPGVKEDKPADQKPFFKEIIDILKPENLKQNKTLYLLFFNLALSNIGLQISFPYIFIYIEHNLGFTKTDISIIGGTVILLTAIVSLLVGLLSHRINRLAILYVSVVVNSVFLFIFAFAKSMVLVIIFYFLALAGSMSATVVHSAWLLDLYPKGKYGKYQGVRMIFYVAIPMTVGPPVGSWIIRTWGEYSTSIEGFDEYIPPSLVFMVSAVAILLAVIPLFFIKWNEGKVLLKQSETEEQEPNAAKLES